MDKPYPEITENFAKDILQKAYPTYKKDEPTVQDIYSNSTNQKPATISNCEQLNIRTAPSKDATVLSVVDHNTILLVGEFLDDGWVHVYMPDGVEGYAMSDFIKEV